MSTSDGAALYLSAPLAPCSSIRDRSTDIERVGQDTRQTYLPSSSVYICPSLSDPRGGSFKGGSIIAGYGWSCLNKVDRQLGRNRKAAGLNDLYPTARQTLVLYILFDLDDS